MSSTPDTDPIMQAAERLHYRNSDGATAMLGDVVRPVSEVMAGVFRIPAETVVTTICQDGQLCVRTTRPEPFNDAGTFWPCRFRLVRRAAAR